MPLEHWMTFATFSEQEFFTYPTNDTFHGVILNGNMVAHAPAGIAAFLIGKVSPKACFVIDPMTHAFQHNPETISNAKGPKSSIRKLAASYGDFISERLGSSPIDAVTIHKNLEEFTRNVLNFQWKYLENHFKSNSDSKYLDDDEVVRRPSILVAPYFYLTEENFRVWLPEMSAAATLSVELAKDLDPVPKVYSALVIDRSMLQQDDLFRELHESIAHCGLDGVLLWIDDFDEVSASSLELNGLARFCGLLRGSGLDVLNIHGGYFSCLLGSSAFGEKLTGVSHGPEFGESRGVVPVGGGIPISRFYVPDLHLRAKFRDFVPIALSKGWLASAEEYHRSVCGCIECVKVLDGDPGNFSLYGESDVKSIQRKHGVVRIEFPTTKAKERCLRHYLNRKKEEFRFVSASNRQALIADLSHAHEKFYGPEAAQGTSHLGKWRRVLEAL